MLSRIKDILHAHKMAFTFLIFSIVGLIAFSFIDKSRHSSYILKMTYYFFVLAFLALVMYFIYNLMNYCSKRINNKLASYIFSTFRNSITAFFFLLSLDLAFPLLDLSDAHIHFFQKIFNVLIIITLSWIFIGMIMTLEKIFLFKFQEKNTLQLKSYYTKIHVLRQVIIFFILIISLAAILMAFDAAREVGISIIASAGFLGVVAAFAAQKTLSTLVSGLQLALTQPIKIDDAVFIQNEFGIVEEITLTHAVVRLWDLRRLVIPINFFLENIFQNWSTKSNELLGTVFLNIDYTVNVNELRTELHRILEVSPYWDKKIGNIDVTDFKEIYLELRVLVSARDADYLWKLRCEVREKLLDFLLLHYPNCIPKFRIMNTVK